LAEYPVDTHHGGGDRELFGVTCGIGQSGARGVTPQVKLAVGDNDAEYCMGPHNAMNFTEDGKPGVEAEMFQTVFGEYAADITVRERKPAGDIPTHFDSGMPTIVEIAKISMGIRATTNIQICAGLLDVGESTTIADHGRNDPLNFRVAQWMTT